MAKFCKKCGTQLEEGGKFCPGCGAALETEPAQAPPPPPPAQQAPPPPAQQAPPPPAQQAPPPPVQQAPPAPPAQQAPPPPAQYSAPPPQQPVYAGAYAAQPQKKKFPKILLVLIIVAAVIVVAVIAANLATGNYSQKDFFTIGSDQVPSVKLVLGEERKITGVTSSTSGGVETIVIKYQVEENQNSEMQKYANALLSEFGFIKTTAHDFGGPAGYGNQVAKKSEEEGVIVLVDIDFDTSGYTLTLTRGKGTLTITEEPVEEEPIEEEEEEPVIAEEMIEIYIPRIFAENLDEYSVRENAQRDGYEYSFNEDGSATYTMTEEVQQALLANTTQTMVDLFEMLFLEETPGLIEISYTDDFGEITIIATQEFFGDEEMSGEIIFMLGFVAPFYQLYQGFGEQAQSLIVLIEEGAAGPFSILVSPYDFLE